MSRFIFFICAVLALHPAYSGEIKKWIDKDGNVHFGDTPPAAQATERVEVIDAHSGNASASGGAFRPGERAMLRNYENRYTVTGTYESPESEPYKAARSDCNRYSRNRDRYKRKLRTGYDPSEKDHIKGLAEDWGGLYDKYCK